MLTTDNTRLEELRRRVQRDPASISFAALAEEYRRLGLFQQAIETCRAGLLRHPAYLSARVTLGRALLEIGDYDTAASELEHVLRGAPENLAAIRALAEIHRRRGEMSEAFEHYRDAFDDPESPDPPGPFQTPAAPVLVQTPAAPMSFQTPAAPVPFRTPAAPVPFPAVPVAVQSSAVNIPAEPPALAALEEFLQAIERARRDLILQSGR